MAQVQQFHLRREPAAWPYALLRARLAEARKAAGLTQQELADRIGRPQSFIAKMEGGERSLDVVEFVAIARIIGLDTNSLIEAVADELVKMEV